MERQKKQLATIQTIPGIAQLNNVNSLNYFVRRWTDFAPGVQKMHNRDSAVDRAVKSKIEGYPSGGRRMCRIYVGTEQGGLTRYLRRKNGFRRRQNPPYFYLQKVHFLMPKLDSGRDL